MSQNTIINSALTLSINSVPGEDKRFPSLSTESVFTFGDFRLQRNLTKNILSGETNNVSFSKFGTISSLSNTNTFDSTAVLNITTNDLNLKKDEAHSYAYFGSFFTKVSTAINSVLEKFPYGLLSYNAGTGTTLYNYSNTLTGTSIFSIPSSAITNNGDIIYASGYTASTSTINLFNDFETFEVELSSSTRYSASYKILSYSYSGSTGIMQFEIDGQLFSANTPFTTTAIYVLPSKERYYQFKKSLSNLEYQLLIEQKFMVPDPDDDTFSSEEFLWPKSIDGFSPDGYGSAFTNYFQSLSASCISIDQIKTDWMIRTMIPENYLELDSDRISKENNGLYRRITTIYATEFDKIKQYIDGIAYSHSVTYSNEESIPNKFLHRLSSLLGWQPVNEFNDVDIFEYLAQEDSDGLTVSDYNHELWKKILININWLYKKKGTREALEFIFKLMGAPNCLINFNELVYRIQSAVSGTTDSDLFSIKINEETGYPDYSKGSKFVFQENGPGAGDGDEYIKQWEPEYNPIREVDNVKVYTGDTATFGTANLMNSKQVNIELSPATAIECDINSWYDLGFVSGGTTVGVPTWIDVDGVNLHIPASISGMSLQNWLTYVYNNSLDPKNRKTIGYKTGNHTTYYSTLRDIYLAYYYWNNTGSASNRLNFRKLEAFLALIERNFGAYIRRLIPATTIIEGEGVLYRNTLFNRQKFVYPPGINDGSEFQIPAPLSPNLEINGVAVHSTINDIINPQINTISTQININDVYNPVISAFNISNTLDTGINPTISAVVINSELSETNLLISNPLSQMLGDISGFPTSGTLEAQPPYVARQYTTKTSVTTLSVITGTATA